MAHFYADIHGNRGPASRMGTPASGISGHIRGWNIGARVQLSVNEAGEDIVRVTLTGGSNGRPLHADGSEVCLFEGTREQAEQYMR